MTRSSGPHFIHASGSADALAIGPAERRYFIVNQEQPTMRALRQPSLAQRLAVVISTLAIDGDEHGVRTELQEIQERLASLTSLTDMGTACRAIVGARTEEEEAAACKALAKLLSDDLDAAIARGDFLAADQSTQPHPRWNAAKPSPRHPQTLDAWDWRQDGGPGGGAGNSRTGVERSIPRLAVAADHADPRAPDQMALVLRIDLIRVLGELVWRRGQVESLRSQMEKARTNSTNTTTEDTTAMNNRSVFVYAPQGTGKTHHAPAIAKHFGLGEVVDLEGHERARDLKATNVLYLSHQRPAWADADDRRVMHLDQAKHLAGVK